MLTCFYASTVVNWFYSKLTDLRRHAPRIKPGLHKAVHVRRKLSMRSLCNYIFCLLLFTSLYAQSQTYRHRPEYSVILSSELGKKLLDQCSRSVPGNITNYWNPDSIQIEQLFSNFKSILELSSEGCCLPSAKIDSLESYAFQFCGVVIGKRRYIYINAFLFQSKVDFTRFYRNWQEVPIKICDGGKGYWGALFDTETLQFRNLSFNGVG
jgi:hypothetical protein